MNLTKNQKPDDTDKICLSVKYPLKSKSQLLIKGREKVGIKFLKNTKAFTDHSQSIDDVYENLGDYNPAKKSRRLIIFDDMIADMESKKKSPFVTELFVRERKLDISLVFISNFSLILKIS